MTPTSGTIELRFRNRKEFLAVFLDDIGEGGLLWKGEQHVDMDEVLTISIRFAGMPNTWEMRCRVIWRHAKPPGRDDLPKGVGLTVEPESMDVLGDLLEFAHSQDPGESSLYRAEERTGVRHSVPYLAEFLVNKRLMQGKLVDISEGGCFIVTEHPLPVQTRFVFFMYRPHRPRPWVLEGEVMRVEREGDNKGMGIRLQFDTKRHRAEIRRLVQKLESGADNAPEEVDSSTYSTNAFTSVDPNEVGSTG